ncbi:histidine phosphatase family protein [Ideonella sp. B7]|uniref:histidine phosphatase family protein n=1 Tax=Ideonella benzenivorans TaxID=2831643 RepID=UPI001CEC8D93|nr:histidine phosphatase family protein [Ideonella benzenivorans]MCA6215799.1 histidine phosphatase family protein [Ideonella benzenivorans]
MGEIVLIRHGQASFGEDDYDRLSDRGVAQSRRLGLALKAMGQQAPRVVCGRLRRHRDTAIHCLAGAGTVTEPEVRAAWDEFDHMAVLRAAWPRYADLAALRGDMAAAPSPRGFFQDVFTQAMLRWVGGDHDAEYAETWAAFQARCRDGLQRLQEELDPAQTVLVFTSGGPIAVVMQALLNLATPAALALNAVLVNTGVTRVSTGRQGARLLSFNAHDHLLQAGSEWVTHR